MRYGLGMGMGYTVELDKGLVDDTGFNLVLGRYIRYKECDGVYVYMFGNRTEQVGFMGIVIKHVARFRSVEMGGFFVYAS